MKICYSGFGGILAYDYTDEIMAYLDGKSPEQDRAESEPQSED